VITILKLLKKQLSQNHFSRKFITKHYNTDILLTSSKLKKKKNILVLDWYLRDIKNRALCIHKMSH